MAEEATGVSGGGGEVEYDIWCAAKRAWLAYWRGFDSDSWKSMSPALRAFWLDYAKSSAGIHGGPDGKALVGEVSRLRAGDEDGHLGCDDAGGTAALVPESGGKVVPHQTSVPRLRPVLPSFLGDPEGPAAMSALHWSRRGVRPGGKVEHLIEWLANWCQGTPPLYIPTGKVRKAKGE